MKRTLKKIVAILLAAVIISASFAPAKEVKADTIKTPTTIRCGVGLRYSGYFSIRLSSAKDKVKKLTVTKGGKKTNKLKVKKTYTSLYSNGASYIGYDFYATKAGTYKIKLKIKKGSGGSTTRTIKVYAYGSGATFKKVTINGKNVINKYHSYNCFTSKKSGKVKFTLAPGCKITNIKVEKLNQNGDVKTTSFKNGRKVTFGKVGYCNSSNRSSNDYINQYESKGFLSYTKFIITYTDKSDLDSTAEHTETFYIYRKASQWP